MIEIDVPPYQVGSLSTICEIVIGEILKHHRIESDLCSNTLYNAAKYCLRDLYRIDAQQNSSITISKFAGYWGFWVRKLKPLSSAYFLPELSEDGTYSPENLGEDGELSTDYKQKNVVENVNEIIALELAVNLIIELRKSAEGIDPKFAFEDKVRDACTAIPGGKCNKVDCFMEYTKNYLFFDQNYHFDYITYSMRHRTFGPHHFVMLMDQMLYSSCTRLRA